jgi:CHAT domain
LRITVTRGRSRCWRSPSHISKRMRSCNWSCRLGWPTKDAGLAQKRAWRDRAQTGPSMRSASVSEDTRSIMGRHRGAGALSLTSSDALLKESCEYRQRPLQHLRSARRFTLVVKTSTISLELIYPIFNMRLDADFVALSACQTALGKEIKGEGLVGLTRGFMHAGAPRVVASLWQVSDVATAERMKKFYTGMLQRRQPAAAALRAAQLELARDPRWASPYFWAGFVLQGDWK